MSRYRLRGERGTRHENKYSSGIGKNMLFYVSLYLSPPFVTLVSCSLIASSAPSLEEGLMRSYGKSGCGRPKVALLVIEYRCNNNNNLLSFNNTKIGHINLLQKIKVSHSRKILSLKPFASIAIRAIKTYKKLQNSLCKNCQILELACTKYNYIFSI